MYYKDVENSNNVQIPYNNEEGNDEKEDELDLEAMISSLHWADYLLMKLSLYNSFMLDPKACFLSIYLTPMGLVASFFFDWFGCLVFLQ